jgi:hypothetical protein
MLSKTSPIGSFTMSLLSSVQKERLGALLAALIDQQAARVIVEPQSRSTGFWFGGGNTVQDDDGTLWVCGRYRNFGDSRTGLAAGQRGLECALFASRDGGQTFTKEKSWSKADLSFADNEVLSIEGTALHRRADGSWELFISSEKKRAYPGVVADYLKPGTGVWSVDLLVAPTIAELSPASIRQVLAEYDDPGYVHVKDPVAAGDFAGETQLVFCSHPFCWSSSNSGLATRAADSEEFVVQTQEVVHRGPNWDVAGSRVTCRFDVPQTGVFADTPCSVLMYDGLECVRQLDENAKAVKRPRGYSCEEISGAFFGPTGSWEGFERLSYLAPLFISPYGTGCSRYADVLVTEAGLYATWQQSQDDFSQPLVAHFLPMERVAQILA